MRMTEPLHIVGGGMAGCEAAWQAAGMGVPVILHEMRPGVATFRASHAASGGDGLLQLLPLRR